MCPRKAISLSPHGVGRLGLLGDGLVGVAKDEPDVDVGMLLLDQLHLLSVIRLEQPLGLDDDAVGDQEVWGVLVIGLGFRVDELEGLELGGKSGGLLDLLGDLLL